MYKTIAPVHVFWERMKWTLSSWSNQSLLGSSNARSSESSKDRRPSDQNSGRKDSGRESEINWGGLVRRPQVANADSDVELVNVHVPSSQRSKYTTKTSGHFEEGDMV
jgi:hypothetical protein